MFENAIDVSMEYRRKKVDLVICATLCIVNIIDGKLPWCHDTKILSRDSFIVVMLEFISLQYSYPNSSLDLANHLA